MLGEVVSGIDSGERLLICGNMNGHVGSEIDGFEDAHEGFGFGKRNVVMRCRVCHWVFKVGQFMISQNKPKAIIKHCAPDPFLFSDPI